MSWRKKGGEQSRLERSRRRLPLERTRCDALLEKERELGGARHCSCKRACPGALFCFFSLSASGKHRRTCSSPKQRENVVAEGGRRGRGRCSSSRGRRRRGRRCRRRRRRLRDCERRERCLSSLRPAHGRRHGAPELDIGEPEGRHSCWNGEAGRGRFTASGRSNRPPFFFFFGREELGRGTRLPRVLGSLEGLRGDAARGAEGSSRRG